MAFMRIKKFIYRLLSIGCVVLCAVLLKRFCYAQTDSFALHKILSSLSFHPEWETLAPEEQALETVFDQSYHYLSKGAQSYVFASDDGQYVIKFFRLNRLLPPWWTHLNPLPPALNAVRVGKILQKNQELAKDFESYVLAYQEMRAETGLLFVHLNKTQDLKHSLKIIDRLGIAYTLDLDGIEFLVQRKADLLYPGIAQKVEQEGLETGQALISSLVHLLSSRYQKGLFDKDPDLNTNFGVLDHAVIQIDVGRFRRQSDYPKTPMRDELLRITDNLHQWLDVHYPPLAKHLKQEIAQLCE